MHRNEEFMIYHFEYAEEKYSYDTSIGWIEKEDGEIYYKCIPVLYNLSDGFNSIPDNMKRDVLECCVHCYYYGRDVGKEEVQKEVKRALGLG